ncbi:Cation efflux family protein [Daejeonella rubra]|uniref:Cation efflux family protein n=1 Tax=Daejeonella rubra TaxID=990371 RepID=A0A1G9NL08_9SPHI|nr:cation transporter [Daejeonella rubra]SDL87069.1 Cation efflux family protein [Daejeonella rubra]
MSNMETEFELDVSNKAERRTLRLVLVINLSQAALAGIVGFFADSTGLMGAALDNLADAGVYIVSLYAVGRSALAKSRAAYLSGTLLIILGLGLLIEVVRRFVAGGEPAGILMIVTAIINALSNLFCVKLLSAHRDKGAHMKASMIFTGNDMMVNLGIVVSGIMVMIFKSSIPDLVIGLVVVGISIKGGIEILREANKKQ